MEKNLERKLCRKMCLLRPGLASAQPVKVRRGREEGR